MDPTATRGNCHSKLSPGFAYSRPVKLKFSPESSVFSLRTRVSCMQRRRRWETGVSVPTTGTSRTLGRETAWASSVLERREEIQQRSPYENRLKSTWNVFMPVRETGYVSVVKFAAVSFSPLSCAVLELAGVDSRPGQGQPPSHSCHRTALCSNATALKGKTTLI